MYAYPENIVSVIIVMCAPFALLFLVSLPFQWIGWRRSLGEGVKWQKGKEPSFVEFLLNEDLYDRSLAFENSTRLVRKNPQRYGLPLDYFEKKDAELAQVPEVVVNNGLTIDDEEYKDLNRPGPKSIRKLFEVCVSLGILVSVPFGIAVGVDMLVSAYVPSNYWGLATISGMLAGLILMIMASSAMDTASGKLIRKHCMRLFRGYAYPILLIAGIFLGWHWRDARPPNDMEKAQRIAWHACAKIPECIETATMANGGNEVQYYISVP